MLASESISSNAFGKPATLTNVEMIHAPTRAANNEAVVWEVSTCALLSKIFDLQGSPSGYLVAVIRHVFVTAATAFPITDITSCGQRKYRYKVLIGDIRLRIRGLCRQVCRDKGVDIIRSVLSADHVHMFVSVPPKLAISDLVRLMKGISQIPPAPAGRWFSD